MSERREFFWAVKPGTPMAAGAFVLVLANRYAIVYGVEMAGWKSSITTPLSLATRVSTAE